MDVHIVWLRATTDNPSYEGSEEFQKSAVFHFHSTGSSFTGSPYKAVMSSYVYNNQKCI